jgi:hypothetical protein
MKRYYFLLMVENKDRYSNKMLFGISHHFITLIMVYQVKLIVIGNFCFLWYLFFQRFFISKLIIY